MNGPAKRQKETIVKKGLLHLAENLFIERLDAQEVHLPQIMEDLDFSIRSLFYHGMEQRLFDFFQIKPNMRILDLGCGTGFLTEWLYRTYPDHELEIVGVDLQEVLLSKATERANAASFPIVYMRGDAHALSFADDSFDLIVSHTLIKWVEEPKRVLSEMYRVLKQDGLLCIGERILPPVFLSKDRIDQIVQRKTESMMNSIPHPQIALELPERLNQMGMRGVDCIAFSVPTRMGKTGEALRNFESKIGTPGNREQVRLFIHQLLWASGRK